jgi:hypothetical protein
MGDGPLRIESIEAKELEDMVDKAVDMVQNLDIIEMGLDPLEDGEEEKKDASDPKEPIARDGYSGENCPMNLLPENLDVDFDA